jgi:hypothetical protein
MPRILVANIDNENMLADERAFTKEFCLASSLTAGRMSWFARPGDVVVLPRDLSPAFKTYMARLMGHAPESVSFVLPEWGDRQFRPLGSHELLRLGVVEQLSHRIDNPHDWSLYPYCYERGIHLLAEALGLDENREARPFMKQGGAELLNDKRVFRSVAAGRNIAIAEGTVCAMPRDLVRAVGALIDVTGAVIIKQDRHSGGLGNLIISKTPEISGQGAMQIYLIGPEAPLPEVAQTVWDRLAYEEHTPLIVEAYYAIAAAVTAEFHIDSERNGVTFMNCGEVRQAPILSGLIMPLALPPYQSAAFIAGATELARLYCDMGYDGLINVDGIVTADGALIYNEVNGRVGGCSHIHHILEAVAGPSYGDTLVTASHSRTVLLSLERVLEILAERNLGFDAALGRGIILTAEDTAGSGFLEYLSVAPTREEALQVETAFESILISEGYEERRGGVEHLANIVAHLTAGRGAEAAPKTAPAKLDIRQTAAGKP